MVDDESEEIDATPDETASRPRGILSKSDRQYLLGESDVEPRSQTERNVRARIRRRIVHGFIDLALLEKQLEERDRELLFFHDAPQTRRAARDWVNTTTGIAGGVAFLYRQAQVDQQDFEEWLKQGVRRVEQPAERATFEIRPLEVSFEVTQPTEVDLQGIVNKIEGGEWESLDTHELLYLIWITEREGEGVSGTPIIEILVNRIEEDWGLEDHPDPAPE